MQIIGHTCLARCQSVRHDVRRSGCGQGHGAGRWLGFHYRRAVCDKLLTPVPPGRHEYSLVRTQTASSIGRRRPVRFLDCMSSAGIRGNICARFAAAAAHVSGRDGCARSASAAVLGAGMPPRCEMVIRHTTDRGMLPVLGCSDGSAGLLPGHRVSTLACKSYYRCATRHGSVGWRRMKLRGAAGQVHASPDVGHSGRAELAWSLAICVVGPLTRLAGRRRLGSSWRPQASGCRRRSVARCLTEVKLRMCPQGGGLVRLAAAGIQVRSQATVGRQRGYCR